ncbi:hypothetical protein PRIC1_003659 [Phytophthora ramorum]
MAKKRRHAAPTAQRASAAVSRDAPVDPEALEKSIQTLRTIYGGLSEEVIRIPSRLERTLLLHSLVALVVQNALMVAQSVSTAQITLVAGTAVWMTRKNFVTMLLPHVALRGSSQREVLSRIAIVVLALSALGAAFYRVEMQLTTEQFLLFVIVFLLDVASIQLVGAAKGRLTRGQIALSAVEVTFLVACFSTCLNYKRGLIYDQSAFVLTAATVFVHTVVLLSVKYVVLHCFNSDTNGAFRKTRQRGAKLMQGILEDIDRDQLLVELTGTSKKKKTKSKARASPSKASSTDDGNSESSLQPRHSVLKEPRVQLAILTLVQALLLLFQLLLSTFVLFSWEMMSALMLSSSHVLWTLGQVRRKVLSCSTITSADQKLRSE